MRHIIDTHTTKQFDRGSIWFVTEFKPIQEVLIWVWMCWTQVDTYARCLMSKAPCSLHWSTKGAHDQRSRSSDVFFESRIGLGSWTNSVNLRVGTTPFSFQTESAISPLTYMDTKLLMTENYDEDVVQCAVIHWTGYNGIRYQWVLVSELVE